ncbi:MAG: SDR family oxidoreductase [Acidimicrobiia bacterium]|nr:SDR family oxidoreductase [Acidimicrobiia bacterium]
MYSAQQDLFRFDPELGGGFAGRRVLITGAGRDGGIGQAFALTAGLNGAESVGVHFHRSYEDGFDLVKRLQAEGVNAFPLQADVTNLRDLWATRSYVIEQMGGLPPNLVICNSGLTERGYTFGRALRAIDDEPTAIRRARVRQHFIDSLEESRTVLDTKIDGFLATTHLWAGEAIHHSEPVRFVYVSSRQAIDPGPSVPGYAISNWAVLQLPAVLKVNLGSASEYASCLSVLFPFVRTGMTNEYAENERVYGRWQPRMLEPHECAEAFAQLLSRPADETDLGMYELLVESPDGTAGGEGAGQVTAAGATEEEATAAVRVVWKQVRLDVTEHELPWSEQTALRF